VLFLIPQYFAGITLICGGGYHGKCTLLRTIACGVYNKLPGDGREYCVTRNDAVVVRAEDGRYEDILDVVAVPGNDSRLFLMPPIPSDATTTSVISASDIDDDVDEHNGEIDMVRCEQLFGRFPQLLGCGLCVKWVLHSSKSLPHASVKDLLEMMERTMDENGGIRAMFDLPYSTTAAAAGEKTPSYFVSGFSYRPRKFEVFMSLTRMRGLTLEDVPATTEDMNEEEKRVAEEERKKNELMELWQSRRKERN